MGSIRQWLDGLGLGRYAEALDPEDLRALMQAYQQAAGGVIARYDGHVAQYLGDGLMTYFGWPTAHEDDAERAVRAAPTSRMRGCATSAAPTTPARRCTRSSSSLSAPPTLRATTPRMPSSTSSKRCSKKALSLGERVWVRWRRWRRRGPCC